MSSRPALTRRGSSSTSLAEAQSPTTAHVKAYVRRVSSKQLLVFPEWDIKVRLLHIIMISINRQLAKNTNFFKFCGFILLWCLYCTDIRAILTTDFEFYGDVRHS